MELSSRSVISTVVNVRYPACQDDQGLTSMSGVEGTLTHVSAVTYILQDGLDLHSPLIS
jgi:hypothetical protein